MPLIELPVIWTIVLDIVAWAIFHMGISLFTLQLPDVFFEKTSILYRTRSWEKEGEIWQKYFTIKSWVKYIPDGSRLLGETGFYKKKLQQTNADYFETFILETKRAELTHVLSILPAFLFFIWNPIWAGWVMVVYALVVNVPIILLQRYNRPRLEKIVKRKEARASYK